MHRYTKLLLTTLTATALLAMAVSSATANRLSITSQTFRTTWTSLRLTNTVNAGVVLCQVTLEGSFHSATISKVTNALIGYVSRASVINSCTGGTATIHGETLPWHVRFNGYSGTLPNITLVVLKLTGVSFEIHDNTSGNTCTAVTEELHPAVGRITVNATSGLAENLTPDRNAQIPLRNGAGGIFCGLANGIFGGESQTLTQLGNTNTISIRLI